MVSLPLDLALTVLTLATCLMALQSIILTVEIARLRRDVQMVLRTTSELNHAVNPWAGDNEPTEPGRPPRKRRLSVYFQPIPRLLGKHKRRPPE